MGINTRFGLVLVTVFALLAAWGFWAGHGSAWMAWLIAAVVLLAITVTVPRVLEPLKTVWMKIGYVLHVVVSPILLGLFYYTVVVPIGLVMKLLGRDPLHLKRDRQSYWIQRQPPGPDPRTMPELY